MTVHIDTVDTELSVLPGGEGGAADSDGDPAASPWAADIRRFLAARRYADLVARTAAGGFDD